MRDIRFKAWNKKEKEMLKVDAIIFDNRTTTIMHDKYILDDSDDIYYFDDIVLCQYTGMKDCNGAEIYENDVVQFKNRAGIVIIDIDVWIQCKDGKYRLSDYKSNELYIIGNKFNIKEEK